MKTLFLNLFPFEESYSFQKKLVIQRMGREIEDTILGFVHPPCITIGRQGGQENIKCQVNIPVYFIERGGKATYHGPGQLVSYFIWDIRNYGIKGFLDLLEEIVASTLEKLGIDGKGIAKNLKGRGVWIRDKKVASIGIAVRKWVSFHGISINIDRKVHEGFEKILPCGLNSSEVCCLEHFDIDTDARAVFDILVSSTKELRHARLKAVT